MNKGNIDNLTVETIRMLGADMVKEANSGHPGLPLEAANITYVLWKYFLRFNPANPNWVNRDRFVLSCGHGSALLYSLFYVLGFDFSIEDLKNFRQAGSKTPGHPEYMDVPGVETTTGPLGQGIATAVGMAMGQKFLNKQDSSLDYRIYSLCSDGDMMEGISHEAASLAGHLKLNNLVYLYLDNNITIDGKTDISLSDDAKMRFESYGWDVYTTDAYDTENIKSILTDVQENQTKPVLIVAKSIIGKGVKNKENTSAAHGAPFSAEEMQQLKEDSGWPLESFFVPDEVKAQRDLFVKTGQEAEASIGSGNANDLKDITDVIDSSVFDEISFKEGDTIATRVASGKVLNVLKDKFPQLIGGSADLASSTGTLLKGEDDFLAPSYSGRNIYFGVREHAMGAVLNGLALTGNIVPFGGTFLVFADYMRPAIRLAAMMKLRVLYVFSHDSFYVGEDGPTHQPIEHVASLRIIPNLTVIRPADAEDVKFAYQAAIENKNGPTALIMTRQNLPVLERKENQASDLKKGAYFIKKAEGNNKPSVKIFASGSEVSLALDVAVSIADDFDTEVVNVASFELLQKADTAYQKEIKEKKDYHVVIEAGIATGWEKISGCDAIFITKEDFGLSGPAAVLGEKFGFTKESVSRRIRECVRQ